MSMRHYASDVSFRICMHSFSHAAQIHIQHTSRGCLCIVSQLCSILWPSPVSSSIPVTCMCLLQFPRADTAVWLKCCARSKLIARLSSDSRYNSWSPVHSLSFMGQQQLLGWPTRCWFLIHCSSATYQSRPWSGPLLRSLIWWEEREKKKADLNKSIETQRDSRHPYGLCCQLCCYYYILVLK